MEPRRDIDFIDSALTPTSNDDSQTYFNKAKAFTQKYYSDVYHRISNTRFDDIDSEFFFREYVWVVHATGFSAKAVGGFMPRLLSAYVSPSHIAKESFSETMSRVQLVCNNKQKAEAVYKTSGLIDRLGWDTFKSTYLSSIEKIQGLPYIGKVTCYHLGRNIGLLDSVKPDLHLIRLATHFGYDSPMTMIKAMSDEPIPLGLRDLCVWYYAATFGTIHLRQEGQR